LLLTIEETLVPRNDDDRESSRETMSFRKKRIKVEPPENDGVRRRVGRDPTPTFSLNERQLELLEARKQREQHTESQSSESSANRTPLRTPNPTSRSVMSGVPSESSSNDAQKAFLRQMLQKATKQQHPSSHGESNADQKALLKKVLHKTMGKNASTDHKPRSQNSSFRWKQRAAEKTHSNDKTETAKASIFRQEIKPDKVDETIRQTFRREIIEDKMQTAGEHKDDGLEGYETFLRTLQTEVSGQHSQVCNPLENCHFGAAISSLTSHFLPFSCGRHFRH